MSRLYHPGRAWLFGTAYFVACLLISAFVGVPSQLLNEPVFLNSQLHSGIWVFSTSVVTAYAAYGYLYYWPLGTTSQGRPGHAAALTFGFAWGLAQALLVLAIFGIIHGFVGNRWVAAVVTMLFWSVYIGLWQSRIWDVYVSPDHNIREWNVRKVLVVHVPFLVLTLSHYAAYANTAIFAAWWVFALTVSAWVMRFPTPLDSPVAGHDGRGVAESEVR